MLERVAGFCYRRRRVVLVAWVLFSLGIVTVGGMARPEFSTEYTLAGSDSQRAYDVLAAHFPDRSGGSGEIVFHAPAGLERPEVRQRVQQVVAAVAAVDPVVTGVAGPYGTGSPVPLSADRRTGVAVIQFSTSRTEVPGPVADAIADLVERADGDGLRVELAGTMFAPVPSTGLSETVGLIAAVLILLAAFGSLLLAGMPLLVALVGLFTAMGAVMLATKVLDVPDFTMSVTAMMVLGVGVDYALFIATRFVAGLRSGLGPSRAVRVALGTAGRAVVFAGITVVISLAGMLLMGVAFIQGLAAGSALGVALTMLVALTLLPALLGLAGARMNRRLGPAGPAAADVGDGRGWARWSAAISRRALPVALAGTAALLLLALPVLSMRLGSSDAGNAPAGDTTRRAYDLKTAAYGAGSTAPLQVAVDLRGAGTQAATRVAGAVAAARSVAQVGPAVPSRDGRAALITVVPTGDAQDDQTVELIDDLRDRVIPAAVAGTPVRAHVGGVTASFQDLADRLASRLVLFVAAVLGLSFLLLVLVFRSLLLPLQAVLMTLLSLGAAYGVLVAVFQWGWGTDLIGVGRAGPLESYVPMTLMALLFGLSMDYQVFLLSRVKEARSRTRDTRLALTEGLRASGRVILAAALIMSAVFASFTLSPDRVMKQFGIGLSIAVLVEAAIVLTITPALLILLGRRAWTLPRWLDRLPDLHVEGRVPTQPEPAGERAAAGVRQNT